MTGFGYAEKEGCRVEVRSVNHKFLDVHMRAPSAFYQLEIPFRSILKEHFSRGKFDITLTVQEHAAAALNINTEVVGKICGAFRELQKDLGIKGDIDINTLVGLHDMFIETNRNYDLEDITTLFRTALAGLKEMRTREGNALSSEIGRIVDSLELMNGKVSGLSDAMISGTQTKFHERLKTLMEGTEIDAGRILQEASVIAARLDISEETTRIVSHINQFRQTLKSGGIMGRKLDFLLQELNREVNTIASKSGDYEVSSLSVDMKTEIEKIREQVQNIQ